LIDNFSEAIQFSGEIFAGLAGDKNTPEGPGSVSNTARMFGFGRRLIVTLRDKNQILIMPFIYDKPGSRRIFLKKSLKYAGAISSMGLFYHAAWGGNNNEDMHLALLADTHIKSYKSEQYRGFFPYENLQNVVGQVNEASPQLMLINGDIARLDGQLGDYVAIQEILSSIDDLQVVMTLGNHDNRENFYNVFGNEHKGLQPVQNKHVMVIERPDLQLILLDSLMYVNKTPGFLGYEQRDWLKRFLALPDDRPVFIFFHHTPYDGDSDLLDSDKLFNILIEHKKVKAVFFGHSHRYHIMEREHIKLINHPAVGYNFMDSQPVGWIEARINSRKGSFLLHAVGGNMERDGKSIEIVWS
jgi:3',5'-cyclic-AMP phosphodiesterase